MSRRRSKLPVLMAALLGLGAAAWGGGCGTARRSEPIAGPLQLASDAPRDQAVLRGRAVFAAHCYQCHPAGEAGLGPALNDKPLPGFAIRTQVRQGLGAMPAFGEQEISADQLDDLVSYLFALRANKPGQR